MLARISRHWRLGMPIDISFINSRARLPVLQVSLSAVWAYQETDNNYTWEVKAGHRPLRLSTKPSMSLDIPRKSPVRHGPRPEMRLAWWALFHFNSIGRTCTLRISLESIAAEMQAVLASYT